MLSTIRAVFAVARVLLRERRDRALENLALRQQLALYERQRKRPKLQARHRVLWTLLSRYWPEWRRVLVVVRPETVVAWHRKGFRVFWAWKLRRTATGRPPKDARIRQRELHLG